MAVRRLPAWGVLALGLAGCADEPGADSRLVAMPDSAVRRCAELAPRRAIPVLCPTRLPAARWYVRYQTLRSGRLEYLTNLDTKPSLSGDPFHVLAGGRRGRFSLRTVAGRWPVDADLDRDLGLVGALPLKPGQRHDAQQPVRPALLRRVTVNRHPALLLQVEEYPRGGIHGGHLSVVWNQRRAGYTLSLHFADRSPRPRAEQEAVLIAAAAAMSRFGSAGLRQTVLQRALDRRVERVEAKQRERFG